jgi:hypothetical protein
VKEREYKKTINQKQNAEILQRSQGAFSMKRKKMISKTIQFPPELIDEARQASREMNMSFSELVRTATCLFLKHGCQDKVKKLLAEGYREKSYLNKCICDEFESSDGENVL